jgi:hypothetical protein
MRNLLPLLAAAALPLAGCATSPYGYSGYGSPYGSAYGYNDPVTAVIGALGQSYGGYGYGGFSQAATNACGRYAARYGRATVTGVRQTSSSRIKVYGYSNRGYGRDNWDCTFRSDGRITDFDI